MPIGVERRIMCATGSASADGSTLENFLEALAKPVAHYGEPFENCRKVPAAPYNSCRAVKPARSGYTF